MSRLSPSSTPPDRQTKRTKEGPGFGWTLFMGVLSVLYLGVEFGFNSLIVDTVAGLPSPEETQWLELLGRTISAVGFTLLVWGIITRRCGRLVAKVGLMLLALAVCFPAMFFGQRMLVDAIVDRSTGEQRLTSRYMTWLKAGLSDGLIVIDGLPLDASRSPSPEDKTFLSLAGALVYFDPDFLSTVEDHQEEIVKQVISNVSSDTLDSRYEQYLQARTQIQELWSAYTEGTKSYYRAVGGSDSRAQESWVELNQSVLSSWRDYSEGREKWDRRWGAEADAFYPKAKTMFRRWSRCGTRQGCNSRMERAYREEMVQVFDREDLDYQHWCVSFYVGLIIAPRDSYNVGGRRCPAKQTDFRTAFVEASSRKFEQQTGFSHTLTEAEYLSSGALRREVLADLVDKGIALGPNWSLTDKDAYISAVETKIKWEAKQAFNAGLRGLGGDEKLAPGLRYQHFVASPAVQDKARSMLGGGFVKGVEFHWSKETFFRRVLEPQIQRRVHDEIRNLKQGAPAYEDGASLASEGKQAMRAILVPPVAIAFSLFFGLWNLVSLLSSLAFAALGRRAVPRVRAGLAVVALAGIICAPLILTNVYAENRAVGYFIGEVQESHPVLGRAFDWVIRIQPVAYPIGAVIRQDLSLIASRQINRWIATPND